HLALWPEADTTAIDANLNAETQLVKRICSLGRAARAKAQIKVRLPVAEVHVALRTPAERDAVARNEALILDELNARKLVTIEEEAGVVTFSVKPNLRVLGPRLGSALGEVRSALSTLSPDAIDSIRRGRTIEVAGQELAPSDLLLEENPREGFAAAQESGYTVAITTEITPELAEEGLAREVIRRVQDMRREAALQLTDRITLWYSGDPEVVRVIEAQAAYIQSETLATTLVPGDAPASAHAATHDLDGDTITLALEANQ
ncbi:MAG TPA: DUF5915 domain-containing protein, partial [Tepidiformaceae bacterium]|nr:DUF5915 domain-containing protein [Tepidiformaceae bacterium]